MGKITAIAAIVTVIGVVAVLAWVCYDEWKNGGGR